MIGKTNAISGGGGGTFPTENFLVKADYGKSSLSYSDVTRSYAYDTSKKYYVVASCFVGTANYSSALYTLENETTTLLAIKGEAGQHGYSVKNVQASGGKVTVTFHIFTGYVGLFCTLIPID